MKYSRPYHDAVEMQQILVADVRKQPVRMTDRAVLARAYVELEEMKRKLKMRPLPKSIDVSKLPRNQPKRTQGPSFTETEKESL